MKRAVFVSGSIIFTAILAVLLSACGEVHIVPQQEYEIVKKVGSGEYELIRRQEVEELRKQAELGKSVGRYQTFTRAFRTWRLDTATGENCLLLTTEADWKEPNTALMACAN